MKRTYTDNLGSIAYPRFSKYARIQDNPINVSVNFCGDNQRYSATRTIIPHCCKRSSRSCCPESLVDLAARVAAANIPFQLVEDRYARVPEPVVRKFITWSFPRSEADIRRYSALASCNKFNNNTVIDERSSEVQENIQETSGSLLRTENVCYRDDSPETTFKEGVALANRGAVQQPLQIGFHLSGIVQDYVNEASNPQFSSHDNLQNKVTSSYNVSITFQRCKVTSSTCNCQDGEGIFFCCHVVALLIYRMRNPTKVKIRAPISDSLQQLNRDQLQKLTQYLLAHHLHVLPTAQEIADQFHDPRSHINIVNGAPDPTAGSGFQDDDRWNLDDIDISRHVRNLLTQINSTSSVNQLHSIMKKVREMMKVRDKNGARLLTLITEELLQYDSISSHTFHSTNISGQLWDEIGLLWICVILCPNNQKERGEHINQLKAWSQKSHCPSEDNSSDFPFVGTSSNDRTVLSRAIDAGSLTWNDQHLNAILYGKKRKPVRSVGEISHSGGSANFNSKGQLLWHENVPTACSRVEALRSYGHTLEAIRLALATARSIRENTVSKYRSYKEAHHQIGTLLFQRRYECSLVGHSLNPIRILFETLTISCDTKEEISQNEAGYTRESLRREAFEVCLLAVGEQRCMPRTSQAQEKVLSREKQLIEYMKKLTLDEDLIGVLRRVVNLLMDGGPSSGLGKHVHRESIPMHSFATYLFHTLRPYDRKLAFKVGTLAMRLPILDASGSQQLDNNYSLRDGSFTATLQQPEQLDNRDNYQDVAHYPNPTALFNYPSTWSVIGDFESRQYHLASALLESAKGEEALLQVVIDSIQRHVRNTSNVYQLSRDAFNCAISQSGATNSDSMMLRASMQLAMQVLRMTVRGGTWRRSEMVGWLVTCATEVGLRALKSIIEMWYTLFTPVEACTMVASCVISPNTAMRLNLDPNQREELYQNICKMAVQCAVKDPQSCALCSLTLSETYMTAFDSVYQVIIDASSYRRIDSSQLYAIARYLDQRGFHSRAFTVAYAATCRLHVLCNHDAHPAANDLLWTTQLAQSLGMKELKDLLCVIVSKVSCATVLSDVLRTCTSSISGRLPHCGGNYGNRGLRADRLPLLPLLEASISSFVSTIHSKLSHISPRHYTEFIDFLNKARETFLMAPDGFTEFSRLLANLKTMYKGKKKLLNLVTLRFG